MKIYYANIKPLCEDKKYQHYYQQLPKARQKRADTYLKQIDRVRSVAVFTLLLKLLDEENIRYTDKDFRIDRNGKPYLVGKRVHFNLSHSGDYVIAAISEAKIGVDVEVIKPNQEITELIRYVFNYDENKEYRKTNNPKHFFYRVWTLKESYIKCVGQGLQIKMPTIDFRSPRLKDYLFQNFLCKNHQFAICSYRAPITKIKAVKL